ncbi:MAG: lipoprotein-releasing ABC transporter permease subunit [Geminicoccaceae bacterium]|jgi:lipoprotein-releasing system permease protein|nr:lipoprotein-releasing ABC transporter permease subunit [Geminicoccaceae bacterium]MCB9967658.1 lipoprotein-releasing ABC transporter permease subunit [Geminicoccaceae bacterium]HRY26452.1 lipoprotein-releasing ABC transporter permease subunit [Geminicoccaceae bacterium]
MRSAERLIAWRYLRPTRGEGFISVIAAFALVGIALGVGTLIVVLAVMNGFRSELLGRVLGVNGHATVVAGPEGLADSDVLVTRLRTVDGVLDAMAYVEGQVMASGNNVASGAIVRGVRAEDLARRAVFADNIVEGSLARLDEGGTILIGSRMGQRMGLGVGDRVSLISPQGAATAFGTVPRIQSFEIAGIFEVGMFEYDNSFVYIGIDDAMRYFQLDDRVTAVEILVDDPEMVRQLRPTLTATVAGQGRLVDWQQLNSHFFNALEVERNVMFLILTLIILVAAFNIITGITMLVKSKGRDIAILRSMGATQGAVMRIFFLAGASIGVAGTLIGFGLGIAFALNIDSIRLFLEGLTGAELWSAEIRFLSRLPAEINPDDVTRVVLMGLGLSFLATLYPAWRAARVDPVEALRYE